MPPTLINDVLHWGVNLTKKFAVCMASHPVMNHMADLRIALRDLLGDNVLEKK